VDELELSKAKNFLEKWVETAAEKPTDEDVVSMLIHLAEMVDKEFVHCNREQEAKLEKEKIKKEKTIEGWSHNPENEKEHKAKIDKMRKHRLGLWSILASGLKTVLAMKEVRSFAVDALIMSLGELARGQSKVTAFDVKAKSNRPTQEDLWLRAKFIAAIKKYPENKKAIVKKAAKVMNKSEKKVEKIAYNFDSGPTPSPELAHLVLVAMNWDEKDMSVVDLLGDLTG
jgi:hypothetical protein